MNRDSYPAQPYPAGYHPTAPAYPPAPAHRTVRRRTAYAAAAVAFVLGAVIGAASAGKSGGTDAARTPVSGNPTVSAAASDAAAATHPAVAAKAAAPPAASPAPAPAASIGPGTYAVGADIKPGLYKTSGPNDSGIGMCYWERSSSLSGDFKSIIANGDPTGPTTVQISASDRGFKTDGCAPWVKVG